MSRYLSNHRWQGWSKIRTNVFSRVSWSDEVCRGQGDCACQGRGVFLLFISLFGFNSVLQFIYQTSFCSEFMSFCSREHFATLESKVSYSFHIQDMVFLLSHCSFSRHMFYLLTLVFPSLNVGPFRWAVFFFVGSWRWDLVAYAYGGTCRILYLCPHIL